MSKVSLEEPVDVSVADAGPQLQLNLTPSPEEDTVARFLAYTSPYLFWGTVAVLSVGFLLMR
ncbi:MAG: hypothetical protein AAF541_10825 [Pseudomonadota bacterium]